MRFFLGTHMPNWLTETDVPLFVSHRRLAKYKTLPVARGPWALDSGGFTELQMYGEWRTSPEEYATAVRRYRDEVGNLQWASPQDWMCEPFVISGGRAGPLTFAGTGLSVQEHQRRTVENLLVLRDLAPDLPFAPVLQGWEHDDYLRHVDMYEEAGVQLDYEPIVGVGTVCRREDTETAKRLMTELKEYGLSLHGFGVKGGGAVYPEAMSSADSMSWSFTARRDAHHREKRGLPRTRYGCSHASCANCLLFALDWRKNLLAKIDAA